MEATTSSADVITFKLPAAEKAQLEQIAASEERTVSALLRLLVRERIAKEDA
jgi:hypothetical protein